jgi:hypothetical protein
MLEFILCGKDDGVIAVEYVDTKFNHADPYTKNLGGNDFNRLTNY